MPFYFVGAATLLEQNAIVLVIDRLGPGMMGPYGNTWLDTPHLNRLASESLLFEYALADSPALATVFLAVQTVNWFIDNGGLSWSAGRSAKSAEIMYGWADDRDFVTPFVTDADERSKVVATLDFDDTVSADTIQAVLRANGILDTGGYRKLGRNQLRIGLFPAIDPDDVAALTACLDYVVEQLA